VTRIALGEIFETTGKVYGRETHPQKLLAVETDLLIQEIPP
jgi:hypothetical protein